MAQNKEDYFNSISHVLSTFTKSTQRRIKSAHYYEVAYAAFNEKQYLFFIKYLIKGLLSPRSVVDLLNRIKNRF